MRSTVWGVWLIVWSILAGAACRPLASGAATPDSRFGIIESYDNPAAAAELGVGWTRVEFQWAEVQPDSAEQWLPPVPDDVLAAELAAGREVVGLLIGIPDWARDADLLPAGLDLPPDDPGNLWAAFVRAAVRRHADTIDHWIIWNEPDIWDKAALAHTWDGDEADFARLLKVAYLVAKQENPRAVIHLPAFTYFWDANFGRTQYLERLLAALAADPDAAAHGYYFDVATAHLYFQPAQVYDIITGWQVLLAAAGLDKPFWLVETNAPPVDDPAWPVAGVTLSVLQVEQAAYVPQALAAALAAGVDRLGIFKLQDTESDRQANPEPFGLVRLDGSRRPAFAAYAEAVARLGGVWGAERERWDAVGQVRLDQDGQSTTVVFARLPAPQTAQVAATGDSAEWIDQFGQRQTIRPADGVYTVDLPPAVCSQSIGDYCMIGGPTYYLVQTATRRRPTATPPPTAMPTAVPTATATALPATAATAATAVTVTATAAPTEPPTAVPPTAAPTPTPVAAAPASGGSGLWWLAGGALLLALAAWGFGRTARTRQPQR